MTNNPRSSNDSVDWGYSNLVRLEKELFTLNNTTQLYTANLVHPISSIIHANTYNEIDGYVIQITSGIYAGRLAIVLDFLQSQPTSIDHVYLKNTYNELYTTSGNDGTFITTSIVVGINLEYTTTIILPTDTRAAVLDDVSIIMNTIDTYNITGSPGSFSGNQVSIPVNNISLIDGYQANAIVLEVVYIASIQNFLSAGITQLPISRIGNGYLLNSGVGFNNIGFLNTQRREFQAVQKNGSNQLYVELGLSSLTSTIDVDQIVSIIRLSDGNELWNADNTGSISINNVSNNYQLILNGYNNPNTGDRALIIYFADDISRWQPFTFENTIIERDFESIQVNAAAQEFIVPMHNFISESNVQFQILEPNTDIVLASSSDGYIDALIPRSPFASFGSFAINFGTILNDFGIPIDITSKKIRLLNTLNRNNANVYDISSYNVAENTITIGNDFSQINNRQISIIRILDGQEQWLQNGVIDINNNRLIYPLTPNASQNDEVIVLYYNTNNLRQSGTRIGLNISDTTQNTGVITISGTTINLAKDVIFTATENGLHQNLLTAYRTATGLASNASISDNVRLAAVVKLQKVDTFNSTSTEVLEVLATYDVEQCIIKNNIYFLESSFSDLSLGSLDFVLPSTINNTSIDNSIKIGDRLRISFYYITNNVSENLTFTQNGTLYTNNVFALINKIYVSSGFNSSQSAQLSFTNFNQPITGIRYSPTYNYLAPKQNERITIKYNYNQLISTATLAIENARPINADVLVYEAQQILVNVNMNIVISTQTTIAPSIIIQNVKNALTAAINSTSLGTTLYSSTLIDAASGVGGIIGASIVQFQIDGKTGSVFVITALNNQYLVANNITVQQGD